MIIFDKYSSWKQGMRCTYSLNIIIVIVLVFEVNSYAPN